VRPGDLVGGSLLADQFQESLATAVGHLQCHLV